MVKATMAMIVNVVIGQAVSSCLSIIGSHGGTVNVCCSGEVCGWAVSVLQTSIISSVAMNGG